MKQSGYNANFRLNLFTFKSALKHWEKRLEMDKTGERPLHRDRYWKGEERQTEKEKKKRNWYNKRTGNKPTNVFPIFYPATARGTLVSVWKNIAEEVNKQSQGLVVPKVIEQGGVPLEDVLC